MAVNALGFIADTLSVIQFVETLFPQPQQVITNVQVIAGTGDNTEGAAPNVDCFDVDGFHIGSVGGGQQVHKGEAYVANVPLTPLSDQQSAGAQAQYVSLSAAGNDAICVAGLAVTTSDGQKYGWYGDVAQYCGAPWYYSSTILDSKNLYTPKCVWIDGDGSSGIETKGIGIHLPSFVATPERAQSMINDKDLWCNVDPRMKIYDNLARYQSIPYFDFDPTAEFAPTTHLDMDPAMVKDPAHWKTRPNPDGVGDILESLFPSRKRAVQKRDNEGEEAILPRVNGSNFHTKLIKSSMKHHSAKELCESKSSVGPDFVSMEEHLFCDMEHKKIWPLCDAKITANCFDADKDMLRGGKANGRRDGVTGARIFRKRYETVHEWP